MHLTIIFPVPPIGNFPIGAPPRCQVLAWLAARSSCSCSSFSSSPLLLLHPPPPSSSSPSPFPCPSPLPSHSFPSPSSPPPAPSAPPLHPCLPSPHELAGAGGTWLGKLGSTRRMVGDCLTGGAWGEGCANFWVRPSFVISCCPINRLAHMYICIYVYMHIVVVVIGYAIRVILLVIIWGGILTGRNY